MAFPAIARSGFRKCESGLWRSSAVRAGPWTQVDRFVKTRTIQLQEPRCDLTSLLIEACTPRAGGHRPSHPDPRSVPGALFRPRGALVSVPAACKAFRSTACQDNGMHPYSGR